MVILTRPQIFPSRLSQHTKCPFWLTQERRVSNFPIHNTINFVPLRCLSTRKQISCCDDGGWRIVLADHICRRHMLPGSIRCRTPEDAKTLRSQLLSQFSNNIILEVLIEQALGIFRLDDYSPSLMTNGQKRFAALTKSPSINQEANKPRNLFSS